MFSITTTKATKQGEAPPPGPYETFAEAMASVERFQVDNGAAAETMLVLYGVRVRNGAGAVVWNPATGMGEYQP